MRRVVLVFALGVGMLAMGVTNASASYCTVDPTIGIGLPVHTSLNVSISAVGASTHVYASNTSKTTTFGGGIGLP